MHPVTLRDLDRTSRQQIAAYAGKSLRDSLLQSPDTWDTLQRASAIDCIKYVVLGRKGIFIIQTEPTLKAAWLSDDHLESIAAHIAGAIDLYLLDSSLS